MFRYLFVTVLSNGVDSLSKNLGMLALFVPAPDLRNLRAHLGQPSDLGASTTQPAVIQQLRIPTCNTILSGMTLGRWLVSPLYAHHYPSRPHLAPASSPQFSFGPKFLRRLQAKVHLRRASISCSRTLSQGGISYLAHDPSSPRTRIRNFCASPHCPFGNAPTQTHASKRKVSESSRAE